MIRLLKGSYTLGGIPNVPLEHQELAVANSIDYSHTIVAGDIQVDTSCEVTLSFVPIAKADIVCFCNGLYLHPDDYTIFQDVLTILPGIAVVGDEIVVKPVVSHSEIVLSTKYPQWPVKVFHDGTDGHIQNYSGDLWIDSEYDGNVMLGSIRSHGKIYNAVWNDYADYWDKADDTPEIYGMCYSDYGKGLELPKYKADKCCIGICSDTYGHAVGDKPNTIPIGVSGFILAYVDKEYPAGTLLVNNKGGNLTKAGLLHALLNRGVAKYIRKEKKTKWYGITTKNRHWVKII